MSLANIVSAITAVGVVGSLILGFVNLYSLKKSEQASRRFDVRKTEYQNRIKSFEDNISEYLTLFNDDDLIGPIGALHAQPIEGDFTLKRRTHHNKLVAAYYKATIILNHDNPLFDSLSKALLESKELADEMCSDCSTYSFFQQFFFRGYDGLVDYLKKLANLSQNEIVAEGDSRLIVTAASGANILKDKFERIGGEIERLDILKSDISNFAQAYISQEAILFEAMFVTAKPTARKRK